MNVTEMIESNKVWIPSNLKEDFVKKYGNLTLSDFDRIYKLNEALGATYDNSWATMMHCMNVTSGDLGDQFEKLHWASDVEKAILQDLFNFVSNLLRGRICEKAIWYTESMPIYEE